MFVYCGKKQVSNHVFDWEKEGRSGNKNPDILNLNEKYQNEFIFKILISYLYPLKMPENNDHLVAMSTLGVHIDIHRKEPGLFEEMADPMSTARRIRDDFKCHVAVPYSNITINNH